MAIKKLTPCQAIKKYCRFECSANDVISWKNCDNTKCPLFEFKKGNKPSRRPFSHYATKSSQKGKDVKKVIGTTLKLSIIANRFK